MLSTTLSSGRELTAFQKAVADLSFHGASPIASYGMSFDDISTPDIRVVYAAIDDCVWHARFGACAGFAYHENQLYYFWYQLHNPDTPERDRTLRCFRPVEKFDAVNSTARIPLLDAPNFWDAYNTRPDAKPSFFEDPDAYALAEFARRLRYAMDHSGNTKRIFAMHAQNHSAANWKLKGNFV